MNCRNFLGVTAISLAAVTGCATSPPPVRETTTAQASIRAAEELQARRQPQAAFYLELAREQVRSAQALIRDEEMEQARRLLARAHADAELALALAGEARTQADAEQVRQRIEDLRMQHM